MFRYGDIGLRQTQLFPQGGKSDRKYRKALKYTEVYSGTRLTYEALLAAGEKVTLLDGQERSDDPAVEEARFATALEGMSHATKRLYLADCAAAVLPPSCVYHSTDGRTVLPWPETVKKLVAVGVIPSPWLAADSSVHVDYAGQLYCGKVATMMAAEVGNDGKRETSARAHRARVHLGPGGAPPATSDIADYHFVRAQVRAANGIKIFGRPPTRAEVLATPELFEPNLKQPTIADNVICASCLGNVASRACGGLVLYPHDHYSGVGLLTNVCRTCDTSGRPVNDALIHYDVAAPDVALASECVLRLVQRGGGLGELTVSADAIVAEAREAWAEADWPARDTPAQKRATRKSLRLNPPSSDDEEMEAAPPASPASSRARSPSPPPPPSPPPRRRSPRNRSPGADDDAEYDQYLADVTRLLDKMAGLPSCSRTDRARDALEILRS
jgi:hypothetical protein